MTNKVTPVDVQRRLHLSFSEDDCTTGLAIMPVVQLASDRSTSEANCTILNYAHDSCTPNTEYEHGAGLSTHCGAGGGHPARRHLGEGRRRADIIGPLAALASVGHHTADEAAQTLGLSRRQVYALIRRARLGSGLVTDMAPGQSGGGKGKGRLPESVERIIRELLRTRYLTRQKRSLAALHRSVAQACKAQQLPAPARNTVALRIAALDPLKAAAGGEVGKRPASCKVSAERHHP